jgi:hypothetical protein
MLSLAATLVVAIAEQELPVGFEDDGGETVKVTWLDPPAAGKESDWVPVFGVVGSPVQFTSTFVVAPAGMVPNGRTATPMVAGPEPEEAPGRPATPSLVPPRLFPVDVVPVERLRQRNKDPDFEQMSFVVFLPSSFLVQSPLSFAVEASAGPATLKEARPSARAAKAAPVAREALRRVRFVDNAGSVMKMVLSVVRASGYARRAGHCPRKPELTSGSFNFGGITFT